MKQVLIYFIAGMLATFNTFNITNSNVYTPTLLHSYTPSLDNNTSRSDTLTILFTGDILLDRGVRRYLEYGGMHRVIPDETADFLRSADVVVGNLECPATNVHAPAFKRFVFRGDPQWLDSLRTYGFTHLNLANNHSVDQGRQGLRDTRLNVLKAGLIPFGADSTMQAAARPQQLSFPLPTGEGRGRAFLLASNRLPLESFAYLPDRESVSQEPFDSLVNRVKTIKMADSTAIVIVNLHWGAEHTLQPMPQQRLAIMLRTMPAMEFAAVASEPRCPMITEYMVTPPPQPS